MIALLLARHKDVEAAKGDTKSTDGIPPAIRNFLNRGKTK